MRGRRVVTAFRPERAIVGLSRLADRLLGLVVPGTVASACVPADPWCESYGGYLCRHCHYDCNGNPDCGPSYYCPPGPSC
jgi:hypothetical protein